MTQRPTRPTVDEALNELYDRMVALERQVSGIWIYVGTYPTDPDTTPDSPPFQNGFVNQGGGKQRLRFRYLIGGGVEIQGSITGGTDGTVIFTLPNDVGRYIPDDGSLVRPGADNAHNFAPYEVLTNGDVVYHVSTALTGPPGAPAGSGIAFDVANVGDWLDVETTDVDAVGNGIALVAGGNGNLEIKTTGFGNVLVDSSEDIDLTSAHATNIVAGLDLRITSTSSDIWLDAADAFVSVAAGGGVFQVLVGGIVTLEVQSDGLHLRAGQAVQFDLP